MSAESRFTDLYRQYHRRVLAYAMRRARPGQAQEVVAETFMIAWRKNADLPEPALPWLLVTTRNLLSDQRRHHDRQVVLADELARLASSAASFGPDVEVVERVAVLGALSQLPETDREALFLTVWDGLSNSEAAKVMGCFVGTFAVRLHRARRRLVRELERSDSAAPRVSQLAVPPRRASSSFASELTAKDLPEEGRR